MNRPDGRNKALRAVVRGRVQGVGFRWYAAESARAQGLVGEIFNRADGAVETVAEGRQDALECYLAALRAGPSAAMVGGVEAHWIPSTDAYESFEISPSRHGLT